MQTLLNTLHTGWTWSTWLVLGALSLALLGIGLAVCTFLGRALVAVLASGYESVRRLVWSATGRDWLGWGLASAGTAHWASARELDQAQVFDHADHLPLATWQGQTLYEPRGGHIFLCGPPRSHKSRGIVSPCLKAFPGSVVVSDLRGELYDMTHAAREQRGPVFRFDPASPTSCSLNLLDGIPWGQPEQFGALHRVCAHLLAPPRHSLGQEENPFKAAAVSLLVSLCTHCHSLGQGSFPAVVRWMLEPDQSLSEKLKTLLASPDPQVQDGARQCMDMSERFRASVWSAILTPLVIFRDPVISQHTEKSDFALRDLLVGARPTTLYLAFSFADIRRLGTFLGCFIESLVALVGLRHTGPRQPLLLLLDEIASLGRLEELETSLSHLQGDGCQVFAAVQSLAQVIDIYGPTSPFLGGFASHVHFTPTAGDTLTAGAISTALGQQTTTSATVGFRDHLSSEVGRPLMFLDEVLRMDEQECLVLFQACPPVKGRKLDAPSLPSRWERLWAWRWWLLGGVVVLGLLLALGALLRPGQHRPTATAPASRMPTVSGPSAPTVPTPAVQTPAPRMPAGPWHLRKASEDGAPGETLGTYESETVCRRVLRVHARSGGSCVFVAP